MENDKGMLRKVAEKGVERADAGSLHSRHRVSTVGAADPLPIVRLPACYPYRISRKKSLETVALHATVEAGDGL